MDGLSKHEVEYRKNNGLANDEKIKYTRTPKQIILSNVITLFNILNIAFEGGKTESYEIGLPTKDRGIVLPCGCSAMKIWE